MSFLATVADVHRSTFARRGILRAATVSSLALVPRRATAGNASLIVLIHTEATLKAFERRLGNSLPGADVVVVSRYRDFERLLPRADAALALRPTVEQLNLPINAQGHRKGKSAEPYLLVGTTAGIDPRKVATVGAIDILGYAGLKRFVSQVIGGSPKVKPVTKVADLLPLLQLNAADAVLMPERFFAGVKASTQMELHVTPVGSGALPALAALTDLGQSVAGQLRAAPDISGLMGVTEWN